MFNSNTTVKSRGAVHVAELDSRADVTPATIRYYTRIGLLSPDRKQENGYRCFSAADLHRVEFIRQAQTLGLTIGDIKTILETADQGDVPCEQVKSLVAQRLTSARERITNFLATESRVIDALSTWDTMDDPTPLDGELCPLIERLNVEDRDVPNASRQQTKRRPQGVSGQAALA